jgi:tyrosinase
VNKLPSSDRTLEFYEKAIAQMQTLGLDKALSWRYQGAIHGYFLDENGEFDVTKDPNHVPGDKLPADRDRFWDQCEHDSWFFLLWHRIYLHFFEKIIMKIIRDKFPDGPKDWALPYWDVTNNPLLPAPFRIPDDPKVNHLFIPQRSDDVNKGRPFLDLGRGGRPDISKPDTNLNCLKAKTFKGDKPAFGGRVRHGHGPGLGGTLEQSPHNAVHNDFGSTSFMVNPDKAALDPIFWLHHSNIDRLWEVWIQRQKQLKRLGRTPKDTDTVPDPKDPTKTIPDPDGAFYVNAKFRFHDEDGAEASMKSEDVIDTRQPPLSYEYEDISDPFNGAPFDGGP